MTSRPILSCCSGWKRSSSAPNTCSGGPGRDLPAIFLEHNTPKTDVPSTRHPLADEPGCCWYT